MKDELIKLVDISKQYIQGTTQIMALKGIDLKVGYNEQLTIMGPSGSGKSTLMHPLGCLDRPTSGHYFLRGRDISESDDERLSSIRGKTIGFIFQSFRLLSYATVQKNVELPMEYQRVPQKERSERAAELLAEVGLSHRLNHHPNQLSGGEKQRVAIARALVNNPLIVLADEPTGNLDRKNQHRILDLFQKLFQTKGITLIMVTHDEEVAAWSQRIIRIVDGEIESYTSSLQNEKNLFKINNILSNVVPDDILPNDSSLNYEDIP